MKWAERPPETERISNRRAGSMPHLTPSTNASLATAMLPSDIRLLTSLTILAVPRPPVRLIFFDIASSRPACSAKSSSSPPTWKTSSPAAAWGGSPERATSSTRPRDPELRHHGANSRAVLP